MKLDITVMALAIAMAGATVAHAAPGGSAPPPTDPGDPGDPGDPTPSQQPDYYTDPAAGTSGANSTGTGVNAVPTAPTGSSNYTTPGFGTATAIGGAQQGGTPTQASALSAVGQVFSSTGGTLNQISFVNTNSATGGEELRIAVFSPVAFVGNAIFATPGAVGPTLYSTQTSLLTNYGDKGGVNGNDALFYHTYANINLTLAAGLSYYAYLVPTTNSQIFNGSNSGYASRAYFFELAVQASSLGGEFVFGTSDGSYARVANQAAGTAPYVQALYDISITPAIASVPEPASWALMVAGFGLVGGALRRRAPRARLA